MKEKIKQLIAATMSLHMTTEFHRNLDDINEGYRYNPRPETMIEIKWPIATKQDDLDIPIQIIKFETRRYPTSITERKIIQGTAILTPAGDIDWDFYKKILNNYKSF